MEQLSYIDEHAARVAAPREAVWAALERYVAGSVRAGERSPLTRLLGTEPRAGFVVADRVPGERLSLVGRHRFARYELAFELSDARDGAIQLRAQTYAFFPGLRGRAYRAAVLGTRGHVLATRHVLGRIRRLAAEPALPTQSASRP